MVISKGLSFSSRVEWMKSYEKISRGISDLRFCRDFYDSVCNGRREESTNCVDYLCYIVSYY